MKQSANERAVSPKETTSDDQTAISRRRLLKAITATGGAAVISQLGSDKWTKPIVKIGLLPAHAQTSLVTTISHVQKIFTGINDCVTNNQTGSTNKFSFDYNDLDGNMTAGAVLLFSSNFHNTESTEIDIFNSPGITVGGDAFQGTISFVLCTRFGNDNEVTNQVQLRNARGDLSNLLSITIPRPVNAEETDDAGSEMSRERSRLRP